MQSPYLACRWKANLKIEDLGYQMLSGKVVGEPAPVIFKLRLRIVEDHRSKSSLAAAHRDHSKFGWGGSAMGGGLGGGGSAAALQLFKFLDGITVSSSLNVEYSLNRQGQVLKFSSPVLLPVNVCCANRRNIWLFSKLEHRQFRSRVNPCRDRLILSRTCS